MNAPIDDCDCQMLSEQRLARDGTSWLHIWYELGIECRYHRFVALPSPRSVRR